MNKRGFNTIVVYLDDFLILGNSFKACQMALLELLQLLRELGFQINYNKIDGPAQEMTFLGLVLNSVTMTIRIPNTKLQEIHGLLQKTLNSRKITKRHIQHIVGKLNWITQCTYGGRFHLRRLIDRANTLRASSHRTHVTRDMTLDIVWWLDFMKVFNGTMQIIDSRLALYVIIDAYKIPCGTFYQEDFIYMPWAKQTAKLPLIYLEVLSLEVVANRPVYVHCDNMTACPIINKNTCRYPVVMDSLRRVFWLSAIYNFRIWTVFYPGIFNTLADSVSRLHEQHGYLRLMNNMTNCGYF